MLFCVLRIDFCLPYVVRVPNEKAALHHSIHVILKALAE
jgi:hypothetical protein